jgi:hypothetical protein
MRRSRVLVVTAIALTALPGCGSGPSAADGGAKVATLTSAGTAPSASARPKAERPRERLDSTPEEYEALLVPYNKCMQEHGGAVKSNAKAGARAVTKKEADQAEAANRICEPQFLPLPPWEKDPANPQARDFAIAVVKCLKDKGVTYVEVSEDGISLALGGDQNDSRSISRGMDLMPECERTVAAQLK